MRDFTFETPTKIIFGHTAFEKIGMEILKRKYGKILLVAGGNSKNSVLKELYCKVEKDIQKQNVETVRFFGVTPNPTLTQAKEGVELAKKEKIDAVLAIGGGSVIDTAKCIAAGALYDGDVWDFYMGKEKISKALPVFVVLTLSGTGSENNGNSVISDKDNGVKKLLVSKHLYPEVAFVNPEIQTSVPPSVFSSCCIDAICHIMEQYFDGGDPMETSDALSEALMRTIIKETPKALHDPENYNARSSVMWAASLAMNGVPSLTGLGGKGGDWSSHNMETGLSVLKNSSHGMGLGILFPAWLRYIKEDYTERVARFSRNVFDIFEEDEDRAADAGIRELEKFFASIGCPSSLKEFGVKKEELERLADIISVFIPMGRAKRLKNIDIARILQIAY